VFPDLEGRSMAFGPERIVLGREGDGAGKLEGTELSRQHAEIRRQGLLTLLRDLGSTNGTFVNGQVIQEAALLPGDVVRLGEWIGIVLADVPPAGEIFSMPAPGLHAGPVLRRAIDPLRAVAARGSLPVVLEGETGSGKESLARAVHSWSGRSGPFTAINCAALPEALAEPELFGHAAGAVPGADRERPGHLRAAHGGTLLLDEIVELPLGVQAKLLRAIDQREVVPLGETRPIPIDVQVLAATQVPLREAVEQKRFRPDLLARLDGMTVRLPPLRARIEDVPLLFMKFLAAAVPAASPSVSSLLVEQLCLYDWPGNVRELELVAKRLGTELGEGGRLHRSNLPERILEAKRGGSGTGPTTTTRVPARNPDGSISEGDEARLLAEALKECGGNVARAAAALGITRQRAYRIIENARDVDLASLRMDADDPRLRSRARRSGGPLK
jgi:DNA-binding NtrC family response regulator